jgi:hypothetical protein
MQKGNVGEGFKRENENIGPDGIRMIGLVIRKYAGTNQ